MELAKTSASGEQEVESVQAEQSRIISDQYAENIHTCLRTCPQTAPEVNCISYLFKEIWSGKVKVRMRADGRPWREAVSWGDTASHTMIESVFITSAIGTKEEENVVIIVLSGIFLHVDMDDLGVMVLQGKFAELTAAVAPEIYQKYIPLQGWKGNSVNDSKKKHCMALSRLHCCFTLNGVRVERLWVCFNPYALCVATKIKMVHGKQLILHGHFMS